MESVRQDVFYNIPTVKLNAGLFINYIILITADLQVTLSKIQFTYLYLHVTLNYYIWTFMLLQFIKLNYKRLFSNCSSPIWITDYTSVFCYCLTFTKLFYNLRILIATLIHFKNTSNYSLAGSNLSLKRFNTQHLFLDFSFIPCVLKEKTNGELVSLSF